MSSLAILFFLAAVLFLFISILDRGLLIYWYQDMTEHSWFFWGMNLPYIDHPKGMEEFVKYRSKIILFLGLIHLAGGGAFLFLPDFPILYLVYGLSIIIFSLTLRSHFIDIALEINKKYLGQSTPPRVCQRCGKKIWYPEAHERCPRCGKKL